MYPRREAPGADPKAAPVREPRPRPPDVVARSIQEAQRRIEGDPTQRDHDPEPRQGGELCGEEGRTALEFRRGRPIAGWRAARRRAYVDVAEPLPVVP